MQAEQPTKSLKGIKMTALRSCPFCGGDACESKDGEYYIVRCDNCAAEQYREIRRVARSAWNTRATQPEVTALVKASTALRDQIARWHEGGPSAGPEESKALFEALDSALAAWEAANE